MTNRKTTIDKFLRGIAVAGATLLALAILAVLFAMLGGG